MTNTVFKNIKTFFIPGPENGFVPHSLRSRTIALYLLAVVFIKALSLFSGIMVPTTKFFADVTSQLVISLTNKEREAQGVQPLAENSILDNAAMQKAQDMLANRYFAHTSPQGVDPWHWFKTSGYSYGYAGENLAIDFFESSDVVKAWKDSPSHWKNLINPNYKDIGIAVVRGNVEGYDTTLVVQLFGSPKTAKPAATPNAVPSPKPSVRPSPKASPVARVSPVASIQPTVEGSAIPESTPGTLLVGVTQQTPAQSLVKKNPQAAATAWNALTNPTWILAGILGYLLVTLLIGIFSRRALPQPQAIVGMAIVMMVVVGMMALPNAHDVMHMQARALPPVQTMVP